MKNILLLFISFVLCLCFSSANAQVQDEQPMTFHVQGIATASRVFKDPRISLLIQKQVYINTLALRNIPGYRVQVISTMDRNKAMAAKARLMKLFPHYEAYLSYQSPYFRVRIGDFRSKQNAEDLQKQLNDYFPNGVFTVRDFIHITPEQLLEGQNNEADSTNN